MPVLDVEKLIENRVSAIREYHERSGLKRAQLDVSGGVDSAVMLGLLARAVGPENITAVYSGINSSVESEDRAHEVAEAFGVHLFTIDLTEDYETIVDHIIKQVQWKDRDVHERLSADPTILGSIRSTLRAPIGRAYNRITGGGIRHGTGNECEDSWLRFYQKGGDGEVDTNPIAMLSKGEVYQLAIGLGVPKSILKATPSPDLQGVGDKHNDEDELKSLYGVDWTYSKVALGPHPELGIKTGDYIEVGTIERMSRSFDLLPFAYSQKTLEEVSDSALALAKDGGAWLGYSDDEIRKYVLSARRIEKSTRHKYNPMAFALGDRKELVEAGIITNKLPPRN